MFEQLKNAFFPNTLKRAGLLCLLIVFFITLIGFVVWILNTHFLSNTELKYIPMSPVTAITFILLIAVVLIAILVPQRKYGSLFSYSVLLFILAVLSLKLLEFFMQLNFGLGDQILPSSSHFSYVVLGRMSPVTAVSFYITALAILFIIGKYNYLKRSAGYLLTVVIVINLTVVAGYAFGTPLLYNYVINGNYIIPVALTTAFSFILVCVAGITTLGINYFPLRPLTGSSTKARLLRAFLPLTLGFVIFDGMVYSIPLYGFLNHALVSSIVSLLSLGIASIIIFRVSRTIGEAIDKAEEERKKAEDALRENEALFKAAFGNAPSGMALVGLNSQFLKVNDSWCKVVGYTEEELRNMTYMHLTHPDDQGVGVEDVKRMLANEIDEVRMEKRYRHKLGHDIWVFLEVSIIRNNEGEPLYFVTQLQDISERKRIYETLRQSEELFKKAFSFAPIGMSLVDMKGNFLQVNSAWCESIGYSEEELVDMNFKDVTHPGDLEASQQQLLKITNKEITSFNLVKRYIHKSGIEIWARLSCSAILDNDMNPLYMVGHIKDITAQKKSQEALRESEDRFRTMAEANFEGIVIHERGIVLDANSAFAEMFGYDLKEIIGKPVGLFAARESHDIISLNIKLDYNKPYEAIGLKKDGSTFPGELMGKTLPYKDRTVRVSSIRDITVRKESELALRESEQRYRLMFENNPTPMWVYDVETLQFLDVNNALIKYYGYSKRELLSMTIKDLHSSEDISLAVLINKMSKNTEGISLTGEWKLKRKDQSQVYTEIISHSFVFDDKKAKLVIANDVTDRKNAEERIHQSEKRFRTLVERSSDLYLIVNTKGSITYTAPSTLKILGYTPGDVVGTKIFDLVHPDDVNTVMSLFSDLLQTPGIPFKGLYRTKHKSGKWLWIESVSINLTEDPHINGIVVNSRDITDKKRAEEEAHLLQQLLFSIGTSETLFEALNITIQKICAFTGWVMGEAWLSPKPDKPLKRVTYWHINEEKLVRFNQLSEVTDSTESSLINEAYTSGKTVIIKDLGKSKRFERSAITQEAGIQSALFLPVLSNNEVVAVLNFFMETNSEDEEKVMSIISTIGDQLGTEIQKKRIKDELRFQAAILQGIGESVIATDLKGIITYWNQGSTDLYGYTPEEAIGQSLSIIYSDKYKDSIQSNIKYILEEEDFVGVRKLKHKDGTEKYVDIKTSKFINAEGRLTGLIGIQKDITERIRTEEALKTSEERFSKVFKASPMAITLTTLDEGRFVEVNEAYVNWIEIGRNQLIGKTFEELGYKTSIGDRSEYIDRLLKNGKYAMPEAVSISSKGIKRYAQTFLELIHLGGKPYVLTYINDITEIKESEKALDQSQESFQILFEQAPLAICIFKEGIIESVNKEFLQMFGFRDVLEVKNKHVSSLLNEETTGFMMDKIENGNSLDLPFSYDLIGINSSGNAFPIHVNIAQMQLPNGIASIAYMQNITDRVEASNLLEESQQSLASLVCNLPGMVYRCKNDDSRAMEFTSEGALGLTGYSSSDFVISKKVTYNDIIYPEDRAFVMDEKGKALAMKKPFMMTYRITTASGKIKQVWEQGSLIVLPDGRTVLEGFVTDFKQ